MIKFRAWHKELKAMFEVKSLVFTLNLATIASKNDLFPSRTCSFDDIVLMQSTGLFDTNGVEVFEGDVVNAYDYDYDEGKIYKTTDLTGVITYDKNAFCIQSGKILTDLWVNAEEIEIIGNIYENPDLLESVEE